MFPLIAGGALLLVGVFYLMRQLKGKHGHVHLFRGHSHHEHEHEHEHEQDGDVGEHHAQLHEDHVHQSHSTGLKRSDWTVIGGLFTLLTFSPCEAFLPVFLTGAKYGWLGFMLLSSILAIATVAGMVVFTWLSLLGLQRLRLRWLVRYEPLAVGVVFCTLGLMIIVFEH
jgi:ABC-type nickel/cobalt efflux system permease component RcnA